MSFVAYEEMTFLFMAMTWHLVRFDRPCLFSSEHPVTYWRRPMEGAQMMGIGPATADEVRFPVSPTLALVLTPPDPGARPFDRSPREGIYRGDAQAARRMNQGTLTFPGADRLLLRPDTTHAVPVTPGDLEGGVVSFRPLLAPDGDS